MLTKSSTDTIPEQDPRPRRKGDKFPYLPLFTDAYLADAGHLTDAEHGVYFQLLMAMWRAPNCRLPNDDKWLARKFRRSVDDIRKSVRPIILEFMDNDGNYITQKRLIREWNYCNKTRQRQSVAAKSRWQKEKGMKSGNAPILSYPRKKEEEDAANAAVRPVETKPTLTIVSSDAQPNPEPPPPSLQKDYYCRGKQILGPSSGGVLAKLLKAKGNSVELARAALEMAATKESPREYIGAILRGQELPARVRDPRL